ncbi:MAG: DEAD/DEAH box helicase family protein [Silvanigrellaceae bacterium]|nr:DEAD/DEAH box helicase family protein [Silvanigrellaceae bacterium]
MTVILRKYQEEAIEKVKDSFRRKKRAPCLVLPTGGGKTICFCKIAESAVQNGKKVLILVHRAELLYQASEKLTNFGLSHGRISPEFTPAYYQNIQLASVDTLVKRLDHLKEPDLIIIDEAHHVLKDNKWGRVVEKFKNSKLLGVTATPVRTNGDGLDISAKGFFDDLIIASSVKELMDLGFLCQAEYYAPPSHIDFSNIKIRAGDYDSKGLSAETNKPDITGDAIKHYKNLSNNLPAIAFCVDKKHAEEVAKEFCAAGIHSEFIHGSLKSIDRKSRIEGLANGRIKVLTSVNVISEGTDIPVVTTAILLRKTKSLSLHLQMIGRVLRPFEGKKNAIIIDHVGNIIEHGFADTERTWSLKGIKKRNKKEVTLTPTSQCPSCYSIYYTNKNRICPKCGYEKPIQEREISYSSEDLVKVTEEYKKKRNEEIRNATTVEELQAIAKRENYNPRWVEYRKKYLKKYIPHPAEGL